MKCDKPDECCVFNILGTCEFDDVCLFEQVKKNNERK